MTHAVLCLIAQLAKWLKNQIPKSFSVLIKQKVPKYIYIPKCIPEMSTIDMVSKDTSGLYSIRLGSQPDAIFEILDTKIHKSDARWIAAGEPVVVSGFSILCGMFYLGSSLGGIFQEPSLINPKLQVAKLDIDIEGRKWLRPSYHSSFYLITPESRYAYLQWLAGGRKDPSIESWCPLLFFYGLERRVFIDAVNDPDVKTEIPLIIEEVQRLLNIYNEELLFRSYAESFIAYLKSTNIDFSFYLNSPPKVTLTTYKMPLPLLIGLGQHAINKKPIDAEWALAWVLNDPYICKRTPVERCKDFFSTLFKLKYLTFYPKGMILAKNKTKLQASYCPASPILELQELNINNLPDVMATSVTRKRLSELVNQCSRELEPYSRYLGRNPDNPEALEGLLQLPIDLWTIKARAQLEELRLRIGDNILVMNFSELTELFKSAGVLPRNKVLAFAKALESAHIGIEPDVLAGSKTPKDEDQIALFTIQPEDLQLKDSAAYSAVSVTISIASVMASIDEGTSYKKLTLIAKYIDSWIHLSGSYRMRLKARLQIKFKQPPTLTSLKKNIDTLDIEAKRTIAKFLAQLTQTYGAASHLEVKFLERVYKLMQLDSQLLYSDLHRAAAFEANITQVKPANSNSKSMTKASADAQQGFELDYERIAQLQRETDNVSAILTQVFTDNQAQETGQYIETLQTEQVLSTNVLGLDAEHSAFLRLLISRPKWDRLELEAAAREMELMLDGALEQINDMAFEYFDMPLAEGDNSIEINSEVFKELNI